MMTDNPIIDLWDLPDTLRNPVPAGADDILISLEELQRRHLIRILEYVGGNKSQAAEILGISRATVYQLLSQMKLTTED